MVNKHDPLYQAFEKFSKFGIRDVPLNYPPPGTASKKDPMIMDGARFAKLARDCGLIDHVKVDAAEVDLIFNKIKAKAERKINFEQFLSALLLLAKKKHSEQGIETLREMILACPGPVLGSVTVRKSVRAAIGRWPSARSKRVELVMPRLCVDGCATEIQCPAAPFPGCRPVEGAKVSCSLSALSQTRQVARSCPLSKNTDVLGKTEQASASDGRSDERSIEMATGPSVFDRLTDTRSYTGTQKQKALEARLQDLHL